MKNNIKEEIILYPSQLFCAYDNNRKIIFFLKECVPEAYNECVSEQIDPILSQNYYDKCVEITLSKYHIPKYIPLVIIKRPKNMNNNFYTVKCLYNDNKFTIPSVKVTYDIGTIMIDKYLNSMSNADKIYLSLLLDQFYHSLNHKKSVKIMERKKQKRQ